MIKYRKATECDMKAVASCHKECFAGTFIASWSKKLIANYYTEYLKLNDLFVVATKDDEIVGFCMGYEHGYNAQKNFIHNNRIRLASWLLFLCLRGNKSVSYTHLRPNESTEHLV